MQSDAIKQLIESQMDAEVRVEGDGHHFEMVVVSSEFEGLTPVKKQQRVYQCLNEQIASGELHAVNMKTYTPEQWEKAKHLQVSGR